MWLPRFHAEVEARKLDLHGEPVAVHHRGRLISVSVEAEDLGLRVGMRLTQARAVCFAAEYVAYIEDRYEPDWKRVLDTCKDHVKTIEPIEQGLVFVGLEGLRRPFEALQCLRSAIEKETGFTCPSGCGPSKLVARIVAEVKAGGVISPREAPEFLERFAVKRLWMLDRNTLKHLQALGITSIGLLQQFSRNRLAEHFGKQAGELYSLARGIDNSPVEALYPPRTVTARVRLPGGVDNPEVIDTTLRKLAGQVARELQLRQDSCGRIAMRLETEEGQSGARTLRLHDRTCEGGDLLRACRILLNRINLPEPIASITIRALDVRHASGVQLNLFATNTAPEGRERTAKALSSVRQQFGKQAAVMGGEIHIPRRQRQLALLAAV